MQHVITYPIPIHSESAIVMRSLAKTSQIRKFLIAKYLLPKFLFKKRCSKVTDDKRKET